MGEQRGHRVSRVCAGSCARQDPCSRQVAIVEGYPPNIVPNTFIVLLQDTLKTRLGGP